MNRGERLGMAATAETTPETGAAERKRHSMATDLFLRLVREKPLGTLGAVIILLLILVGIFADVIAPYGVNEMDLYARLEGPSAAHLMGTDNLGRDLFSRIAYGARISMYVGLGASAIATLGAAIIGIVSGFFGGWVDMVIQRFVDAFMCFPPLFILLTVMSVLGPGLLQVILVLGIWTSIGQSRIVRSAVISIRRNMYVEAARAIGTPPSAILVRHILPNIMAPIIILFTTTMGAMILAEATLSFLGFGIPPPTPAWGGMLSRSGRTFMLYAPWMALWPGLALIVVVYGINMLGDAVRDILDPKLRGGLGRYGGVKVEKKKKWNQAQGLTGGEE